jgi:hypothetical protein
MKVTYTGKDQDPELRCADIEGERRDCAESESRFDPIARAVATMQALASLIRSVHLKRALRAACLSGRTAQSE